MRAFTASILANEAVAGGLSCLRFSAPALSAAQPGQWIGAVQPASLAVLPCPAALTATGPHGEAALLYRRLSAGGQDAGARAISTRPHGHDAAWLGSWFATLAPGDTLEMVGPWGKPWPIDALARHVVLLGSGERLIAVLALARALIDTGASVVVLHDAPGVSALLPPVLLPAAVEYQVATADGSAGVAGTVLDALPPLLTWADALYAALDPALYPALRDMVHRQRLRARRGFATALAAAPLACYAGACDGCTVPLRGDRYALLCKDGPAFDLLDLA